MAVSNDPVVRVLIVDDHAMFAEGMARTLADEPGIEVVGWVVTGGEAVEVCRRDPPDVVLMDFGLPDRDGASTARTIREQSPCTRVVMVTSFVDDSVLLATIDAGCSGYLTKNQPTASVVDAIRAAHAGEALIAPAMLARLLPRLRRTYRGLGSDLTPREMEVLELLAEGVANTEIAARLVVSLNTVRKHVQNILTKLHAHSKLEAVAIAAREQVITVR